MRTVAVCFIYLMALDAYSQQPNIVHFNGQNFEEFKLNVLVTKLLVDQKGFLWVGLENGLARYDGYEFIYYKDNPLDTLGYKGKMVYDIIEDHYGGIWVTTDHGVNYKAPDSKLFFHYHIDRSRITSIVEDKDHNIWCISPRTLMKLDKGIINDTALHSWSAPVGIYFHRLILTNNKLIATGNGLFELDPLNDSLTVNKLLNQNVNGFVKGSKGELIVGIDSGYVIVQYNKVLKRRLNFNSKYYQILGQDKSGTIWVGHSNGLISLTLDKDFNAEEATQYSVGPRTIDLAEDKSGNLFFASSSRILKLSWSYKQYKYFSLPVGFQNSYVWNFIEDGKDLWIGSFDGLFRFNQEKNHYTVFNKHTSNKYGLPHSSVYSLLKDKSSSLWVATGNGVVKYDANLNRFKRLPVEGLCHHLCQSSDGLIWFISENKLYSFNSERWIIHQYDSVGGTPLRPNLIFIDNENVLWTSSNNGLQDFIIDNAKLKPRGNVIEPVQFGGDRVINEDKIGQLWVSYMVGVVVINKQSRQLVKFMNTTNSPLQHDDAYGIVQDQAGNIWLKQHLLGSICINPKTFDVINYSPSWLYSGLFGKFGRQPSCVAAAGSSGKLYTDGHGDFCVFYPDSLRINKIPPQVVLLDLKINGKVRDTNKSFNATENNAEFVVRAIHFDNPKLNRYVYFLDGYDKHWSEPTSNNEIRYSSLPAGTYSFYLKAANSDKVWSTPKLLATFTILPVWWRTTWAYIIYSFMAVGFFVLIYRIKMSQRLAKAESQKLKEIDEFKNQFFTNITHEFRTPLTVISGVAEKIEGQSGILIKRNAEQLLSLINQILELSKVEANAAKLNLEQVELIQYLKYLLQSFESLADEKSIALQFESFSNEIYTVLDKTKFSLIIQNLVTNAIKFTNPNGIISVKIYSNESEITIEVIDTGIGINEAELPFIFNRFYQANNQQKAYKGTGIGLALTKELIVLLNGVIDVESNLGTGTTFIVRLPLIQQKEIKTQKLSISVMNDSLLDENDDKITILLIEDNEDVAAVIHDILNEKYEINSAYDGRQGLQKAIENIPDIIISDVMMPEMSGFEVTQKLKSDSRTSHIPIVLLTAKADLDSRLSGLSYGADIYLAKPFHSKELELHIQNLIQLRNSLRIRYVDDQIPSKESKHPEDKFVIKLQDLIFDRLSNDTFGIDEICREMGVSRTQLHRKLKAITGKSASIYIRELRLAEGKKLLLQNSFTVSEVAYAVGFSDPNYFSRLYSEKYGNSPIEDRKN